MQKVYEFTFIGDPICTCFSETKIVTSSQKRGKNSILQKMIIAWKNSIFNINNSFLDSAPSN